MGIDGDVSQQIITSEPLKGASKVRWSLTYKQITREKHSMFDRLASSAGASLPRPVLTNILAYVRQLPRADTDFVDKTTFTAQLFRTFGLTDAALIERVYQVVATKRRGIEAQKVVSVEDMARLVCIYVGDDLSLKTDFVFRVYNTHGRCDIDSALTTRDIFYKLKPMVRYTGLTNTEEGGEDENMRDIVEIYMSMVDHNGDGQVEYGEFVETVKANSMMLECLGPSFPPRGHLDAFKDILKLTEIEVAAHFRAERRRSLGYPPALQLPENTVQRYYPVRLDLP